MTSQMITNRKFRTYLIFGSFCFSMFVFVWFFIPETKGVSLEAMDQLFGVTEAPEKASVDGDDVQETSEKDTKVQQKEII